VNLPPLPKRLKRARAYVRALPPSVSGQGGQVALMTAVGSVVRGFCIQGEHALDLIDDEFNARCTDSATGALYPWTRDELLIAIKNAAEKSPRDWGNLIQGRTRRRRHQR